MKNIILISIIITMFLSSCDIHEVEESTETEIQIELRSGKNSTVLASTKAYLGEKYECGQTYKVTQQPNNGSVSILEDGNFISYTPLSNNNTDGDLFTVDIISLSGEKVATANMKVTSSKGESCDKGPMITHATTSNKESIRISLIDNDIFCGNYLGSGGVAILGPDCNLSLNDSNTGLFHFSIGSDTNGENNFIEYTPKEGFTGIEVAYYFYAQGFEGFLSDEWWLQPELFEVYYIGKLEIEVTD